MTHPTKTRRPSSEVGGAHPTSLLGVLLSFLPVVTFVASCREASDRAAPETVTVYCSVDEAFARRVFDEFERRSGLGVNVIFDSEAGKTTGLINRIRAERGRPRADVLFSSELFNTIQLAGEGLLQPYDPPTAADIPPRYRDPDSLWTAIGLRGRVLAFDPRRVSPDALPERWEELADPKWSKQLAIANPLFGTTRGHIAAMFALWGNERATAFLEKLREGGALVVDGNSAAVRAVMSGAATMCATDTDDVHVARRDGAVLDVRYLDMGDGGTLWIPSTVAVLAGARRMAAAQKLVDFLVSADAERMLAESESGNTPVRAALRASLDMEMPPQSAVRHDAVAAVMDESARIAREILLR